MASSIPSFAGQRIRCHGDYHLGQLLFTGKDFVIIDFEGDTSRTIGERRVKRSPLSDVASMVRSLDYAVQSVLLGPDRRSRAPARDDSARGSASPAKLGQSAGTNT